MIARAGEITRNENWKRSEGKRREAGESGGHENEKKKKIEKSINC